MAGMLIPRLWPGMWLGFRAQNRHSPGTYLAGQGRPVWRRSLCFVAGAVDRVDDAVATALQDYRDRWTRL